MRISTPFSRWALGLALWTFPIAAGEPPVSRDFLERHCVECHDSETRKGGLDLTSLNFEPKNATNFSRWVTVFDRVAQGEMPPAKKPRPEAREQSRFLLGLNVGLDSADRERIEREGRATQRRLNRYEYENTLRQILQIPWLQVRDALPEDGEAYRFNKVGDALDMSKCSWRGILAQLIRRCVRPWRPRPSDRRSRPDASTPGINAVGPGR